MIVCINRPKGITVIGGLVSGIGLLTLLLLGWVLLPGGYFLLTQELPRRPLCLQEWIVLLTLVEILLFLITGFSLLFLQPWARTGIIVTAIVTLLYTGIMLAVGQWAVDALSNGGSIYPALLLDEHVIGQGEYPGLTPYRISPTFWLTEITALTVLTGFAIRKLLRYFRHPEIVAAFRAIQRQ